MAESFSITLGDPLPLSLTLGDGASGLFPRAFVYDSADVAVTGSPFNLIEVASTGRYTNAAFTPASIGSFTALFIAYTDVGHTTKSTIHDNDQDSFVVQLAQVAASGATINTPANASSVLTTGTTVSGDVTETEQLDGTYWQIEDAAGTLDMYFEFAISADGSPVSATMTGRLNGNNDDLDVFAWNWAGASWDQVGTLVGQGGNSDSPRTYNLFATHVGTGADLGEVRIRFFGTGLTNADLFVDQIFLSYAVITRSVGYALGAIWIDTVNGTAGTTSFINGTADNPSLTLADATTLSTNLGLHHFQIAPGSSITLAQAYTNFVFVGDDWTLALGGQDVTKSIFRGADVNGVYTATGTVNFLDCDLNTITFAHCHAHNCALTGPFIFTGTGVTHLLDQCFSGIPGLDTPTLDLNSVTGLRLNMRHYSGGVEIKNMIAGNNMSFEGDGQIVINANCTGGLIAIRGSFDREDNSGGAVTFADDPRYDVQQVRDAMKLAPAAGAPAAGSVDKHLDDLLGDVVTASSIG